MEIFTFLQSELGASLTKYLGDDIRIHQGSSSQELTPPSGTVDEEHLFWILWWSSWGIPEVISYLSGSWLKEFTLMILDYPTGMPVISGAYEAYDNFSTFYRHHRITNHQSITTSAGLCRATPAMRTTASSTNQLVKWSLELMVTWNPQPGKRTRVEVCWGIKPVAFEVISPVYLLNPSCDLHFRSVIFGWIFSWLLQWVWLPWSPFHWETLHASPGFHQETSQPPGGTFQRDPDAAGSCLLRPASYQDVAIGIFSDGVKNQHDTVYIYSVYI